jgi:predicted ribosome quality control (RQC) complex YloA/Tae2 family protein
MFITSSIICALIPELRENLLLSRIRKFKLSPDYKTLLILTQKGKEWRTLLFSAHPEYCRILSSTEEDFKSLQEWADTSLFSPARDTYIRYIEQIDFDRVLKFSCQKETELGNAEFELFFELTGRNSNAILVQKEKGVILDSLKKIKPAQSRVRQILPGIKYILPPAPKKHNPLKTTQEQFQKMIQAHPQENLHKILTSHFMGVDEFLAQIIAERHLEKAPSKPLHPDILWKSFHSIFEQISTDEISPHLILDSEKNPAGVSLFDLNSVPENQKISFHNLTQAIKEFFSIIIEKEKQARKLQNLQGLAQKGIERLKKRKANLEEEFSLLKEAQDYKKIGGLILSHLKKIKRGAEFVELPDFFVPGRKKIKIKLDPSLSAEANAQAYYKRYRKAQTGTEELENWIHQTEKEIKDLEKISLELQPGGKLPLQKIEAKLSSLGLIKISQPKAREKKKAKYSPREFISADGWKILVGRNNRENDFLTFRIARIEDLWFHAQNTAGSHVVLRKGERKKHPSPKAIEQAASLAAYYSQAKSSKKVEPRLLK